MEAMIEVVLPLLGQTAQANDEAALQVTAGDQPLDKQTRQDGFAATRVIREEEAQRLPRRHGLVNGCNLVR